MSDEDEFDQLAAYRERWGYEWPNCATPDCEHKRCCWAGTGLCYPCSRLLFGRSEMNRRYRATHDAEGGWTGAVVSTSELVAQRKHSNW